MERKYLVTKARKAYRKSVKKTAYGEVSYDRHVYQVRDEYGINRSVYLLDENLNLNRIGLILENYAKRRRQSLMTDG